MANIAYQAHPPTAINLSLSPLDLNVPPDHNGQYHSYSTSTIHSPRSGSKYLSNSEVVSQAVIVPFGWKRELHESRIVYKSPSDTLLWSMDEIARYLMSDGTCKCGLECPFQIDQIFNFDANIRFQKYCTSQPSNDRFCSHKAKLNAIAEYNQHTSNHQQAHNNNSSIHMYKDTHYDHQLDYSQLHAQTNHNHHQPLSHPPHPHPHPHPHHHLQQQQPQPQQHHHQHTDYGSYESEMSQLQSQQQPQPPSHQMNGYHSHSFHQMPQSSHYSPDAQHHQQQQQQQHHQMALNPVNCTQEKRLTQDVTAVTASITEVIPSVGHLIHPPQAPPQPVQYSFIVPQQILVNPILNPVIQSSNSSTPSPVYHHHHHHHSLTPQAPPVSQLPPSNEHATNAIAMNHMSHINFNHQPTTPSSLTTSTSPTIDLPVDFSKRKVARKVNGNSTNKGRSKTVAAMLHMDNNLPS